MPARPPVKLTRRAVDALSVDSRDTVVWDRDLPGFGVRVYASGRKVWCVQAHGRGGGPKRVALGRLAQMPPDEARRKAAEIIDRTKRGLNPVPAAPAAEPTVADLAERCMEAHVMVNCRPNAVESLGRLMRLYILPELGGLRLSEVDRPHYSALHHKMRDKPHQANTVVGVIARMFRLAEAWGMTPQRPNLCRSVRRYRETPRELFLTPEEYRRLGRALDAAEDGGLGV